MMCLSKGIQKGATDQTVATMGSIREGAGGREVGGLRHEFGDDQVPWIGPRSVNRNRDWAGRVPEAADRRCPDAMPGLRTGSCMDHKLRLARRWTAAGAAGGDAGDRGGL